MLKSKQRRRVNTHARAMLPEFSPPACPPGCQSQLDDLDAEVAALSAQVGSLDAAVTTAEGNISSLQSDVATLQTEVAANSAAISTLQSQLTSLALATQIGAPGTTFSFYVTLDGAGVGTFPAIPSPVAPASGYAAAATYFSGAGVGILTCDATSATSAAGAADAGKLVGVIISYLAV